MVTTTPPAVSVDASMIDSTVVTAGRGGADQEPVGHAAAV
jgi:hypothetical protein